MHNIQGIGVLVLWGLGEAKLAEKRVAKSRTAVSLNISMQRCVGQNEFPQSFLYKIRRVNIPI